jgi:hypothetical protein
VSSAINKEKVIRPIIQRFSRFLAGVPDILDETGRNGVDLKKGLRKIPQPLYSRREMNWQN